MMVALPQELKHKQRDIRVFLMDVEDGPVAVFVRVLPDKTRRKVKGKLANLSQKIESAQTQEIADRHANKFGELVQKAVVGQCLGAASITAIAITGDVVAEVPSDLDTAIPARLSIEQVGFLLAALDLAP